MLSRETINPSKVTFPSDRFWYRGEIFSSTFLDAGAIPIPYVEQFVVETGERAKKLIEDRSIIRDLESLIGDERRHSQAHYRYSDSLKMRGYRITLLENINRLPGRFFNRYTGILSQLALCLSIEHLTALMSHHVLENGVFSKEGIEKNMSKFWIWHAREELEHRSTAFNIYIHLGGRYKRRVIVMAVLTSVYISFNTLFVISLLIQNKALFNPSVARDGIKFLFAKNGFYRTIFHGWLSFFKRDFHPKDIDLPQTSPIDAVFNSASSKGTSDL